MASLQLTTPGTSAHDEDDSLDDRVIPDMSRDTSYVQCQMALLLQEHKQLVRAYVERFSCGFSHTPRVRRPLEMVFV
jgi:hypothetical protein